MNLNSKIIMLGILSFSMFTGCIEVSDSDSDSNSKEKEQAYKELEHLDEETYYYSRTSVNKDNFYTDGTLMANNNFDWENYDERDDLRDGYKFTPTETGTYTYYLEVPDTLAIEVDTSPKASGPDDPTITSYGLGQDQSGSFEAEKGESKSIELVLKKASANLLKGTYKFEIARPSEAVASSRSNTSSSNYGDSTSSESKLTCEAYASGLCADYSFSDSSDVDIYKSACSYVSSCKTSGSLGICKVNKDDVRGGVGTVVADLYIYEDVFGSSYDAKNTCENVYSGTFVSN